MKLQKYLEENKTYIIAEMSGNHGGSLEKALEIVRAAAAAGADCVKTQTYTADTITLNARTKAFYLDGGLWDGSWLYDLYKTAYTPWEWMAAIKEECERQGVDFLSTPFDGTAVDYLESIGEEFYKIASFELVDIPLIKKVAGTGKPVIMSCGMAQKEEIQEALDAVYSTGNRNVVLLKCCSAYPTDFDTMHLHTIPDMAERFGVPVGLSDHSEGSLGPVVAVSLGARVIEKHFCITREDKTADSDFSMTAAEFARMVRDVRNTEKILGSGISYGPSKAEEQMLKLRRSLFASADIRKGEAFTRDNIRSVRPSGGLHTRYYDELTGGKHAARDIPFGTPISWDDVE